MASNLPESNRKLRIEEKLGRELIPLLRRLHLVPAMSNTGAEVSA